MVNTRRKTYEPPAASSTYEAPTNDAQKEEEEQTAIQDENNNNLTPEEEQNEIDDQEEASKKRKAPPKKKGGRKKKKKTQKNVTGIPKKLEIKSTEERIREAIGEDDEEVKNSRDDGDAMMVDHEDKSADKMKDDQDVDEDDEDGANEGSSMKSSMKSIIDNRSVKSKRLDWEQGFFYLPKFDCYLPRPVFHMILQYIPPYPFYLTLRGVCQQWLDDLYHNICPNVQSIDLVRRNEFSDSIVYKYPWYNPNAKRKYSDSLRYIALIFPNVTSMCFPIFDPHQLRVPTRFLQYFSNLERMTLFNYSPFTPFYLSVLSSRNDFLLSMDLVDVRSIEIGYPYRRRRGGRTSFPYVLSNMYSSHHKHLKINHSISYGDNNEVIFREIKYLVQEERFSFEAIDFFTLSASKYSKGMLEFFLDKYKQQLELNYKPLIPFEEYFERNGILSAHELCDFIIENQLFKVAFPNAEAVDYAITKKILRNISDVKMGQALFEQAKFPLLFEGKLNPLLELLHTNPFVPQLVSYLCQLVPKLITLGDSDGIVVKDENGNYVHNMNILAAYLKRNRYPTINIYNLIQRLHECGCDLNYIFPESDNNFLHLIPSSYLFEVMPKEYLIMKNNAGQTPLQSLVTSRGELSADFIEEVSKIFNTKGIPLNDTYDNNQNLLHMFAEKKNQPVIETLIGYGIDANAVDTFGKTPLFYMHSIFCKNIQIQTLRKLMQAMDSSMLNHKNNTGKTALTYWLEDLKPSISFTRRQYHYHPRDGTDISALFSVILAMIDAGCDLCEAIQSMNSELMKQGNLPRNISLFLVYLLISVTDDTKHSVYRLLTVICQGKDIKELLTEPFQFQDNEFEDQSLLGIEANALSCLLNLWLSRPDQPSAATVFFDNMCPLVDKSVLDKVFTLEDGSTIDFLYYALLSPTDRTQLLLFFEVMFNIPRSYHYTWYRTPDMAQILPLLVKYSFNDPEMGPLNILQLGCKLGCSDWLQYTLFPNLKSGIITNNEFQQMKNAKTKNGNDLLDIVCKSFNMNLASFISSECSLTFKRSHFEEALAKHQYDFCNSLIQSKSADVKPTLDEIAHVLCGYIQTEEIYDEKSFEDTYIGLFEDYFLAHETTLEEKCNIFNKVFTIRGEKQPSSLRTRHVLPISTQHSDWFQYVQHTLRTNKKLFSKPTETSTVEHKTSLLELCFLHGFVFLTAYFVYGETSVNRRPKKIFMKSELEKEVLLPWATYQNENTGNTLFHLLCTNTENTKATVKQQHENKEYLATDLMQYLKSVKRNNIYNVTNKNGETALFNAYRTQFLIDALTPLTDTSIKNKDGKIASEMTQIELLDAKNRKAKQFY
nr:unnamed protein product [Naegleria fowleri]